MATDEMSSKLIELIRRAEIDQVDFLREYLQKLVQALMELEVTQHLHGLAVSADE